MPEPFLPWGFYFACGGQNKNVHARLEEAAPSTVELRQHAVGAFAAAVPSARSHRCRTVRVSPPPEESPPTRAAAAIRELVPARVPRQRREVCPCAPRLAGEERRS
ncbi:unnamed protein product [Urochloa humidicola]